MHEYVQISSDISCEVWGAESEKAYIYVHGLNGSSKDAENFAGIAEGKGWQVLSFTIPSFEPAGTLPIIRSVYKYACKRWKDISLYGVSIGAWYSMIFFHDKPITQTMLVSPVVSMKNLIARMMNSAGITPQELREKGTIANLSWEYYMFACENEITSWHCPTKILYPENDNITPRNEIEDFAEKFSCGLTVLPDAEHWIHMDRELKFLHRWEEDNISA